MLSTSSLLKKTPKWVWWSFFPGLGGLAIMYAGFKAKTPLWIAWGTSLCLLSFAFNNWLGISWVILIGQVILAFSLKKEYNVKISPRGTLIPEDVETAELIGKIKGTIDINTCSKNDMVKVLGLPIVYANNIESLQNEGYVLTHLEELSEIAGIPENQVRRIAPLIHFCYDDKLEPHLSWRRINVLSVEDLILLGLSQKVAKKIVSERKKQGDYKSVIEVKQRTGLPFHSYRQII
jgi:Helix-hairpin-helix motif